MSATGLTDVVVPDIGDFADVPVIELLVAPGDTVALDDPLVTLESDKATMDVPSPTAGIVRELLVAVGDRVSEGAAIIRLEPVAEPEAEQGAGEPTLGSDPAVAGGAAAVVSPPLPPGGAEPEPASPDGGPVYASPSVRRLAREFGVELRGLAGSGRKGRITKDDVEHARNGGPSAGAGGRGGPVTAGGLGLAPWPTVDFERFGPVERVERTRIQRISAPNLARNWVMIPHVTHHDEADITELEAWRKELNAEPGADGVKVTMVAFLVAASVAALKAFPDFNAALDGETLVRRLYYNIGFAADTPQGLVVPVIAGADRLRLRDTARALTELSGRAREGKLRPADIQGATFTISSLGGIGGTAFTPIINAPEVAILGATRAATKPVWSGTAFVPRLMLPLSLSYDHRVIDGAAAARFTAHLVALLSDFRRLLL